MNFKTLINLAEQEIESQYLSEKEGKNRDIVFSLQQFEKWFEKNKDKLVWNEEAQGYDSLDDIDISNLELTIIPIQFNIIKGDFNCSANYLKILKGCPKEVNRNFNCSYNQLKILDGCPEIINGSVNCSVNQLETLVGCPKEINWDFNCSSNHLKVLDGCPKIINGNFYGYLNKVDFTEEQVRAVCEVKGRIFV